MKYLKVWLDFESVLAPLNDDEIGRLFLAMLHYAGTGEEPAEFKGNESFLWPVAKRDIDVMAEKTEALRLNGSKGGIAKSKKRQALANDSKSKQNLANDSLQDKTRHDKKIHNMTEHNNFIADDEAHKIQAEQNSVIEAAQDAGFIGSNSVRASLIALYAEHGLEKMMKAFESCVKHGAPNLAYLEACLKGAPRKPEKNQDFPQRDYSGVQAEMDASLAEEIKAFRQGAG